MIDLTVPESPKKEKKYPVPESPKKEKKYPNGNLEENMYANAAIINHVNEENDKASKQRPRKELPPPVDSKEIEPKIPVAAVKPSAHDTLKASEPKPERKQEQTMYENVSAMQHQPIPVEELEIYVQRKKVGSFKDEYSVSYQMGF